MFQDFAMFFYSYEAVSGAANVAVMSYPRYCRYRAIQKRLEGCEDEWLHLAAVIAIGGFSGKLPGCRVMFCRDTFYQAEIDDLDIRMDHMCMGIYMFSSYMCVLPCANLVVFKAL